MFLGWLGRGQAAYSVGSYLLLPFPLEVPHSPNRNPGPSPRHLKPIVPIPSNGLTCSLPIKGYVADSATRLFGSDHGQRSR